MPSNSLPVVVVSDFMSRHIGKLRQLGVQTTKVQLVHPMLLSSLGTCLAEIDLRIDDFDTQLQMLLDASNVLGVVIYYHPLAVLGEFWQLLLEYAACEKVAGFIELTEVQDIGHRNLTVRELNVVAGIAAGKTNAEIGAELTISEFTVKTHVRRIMTKLGIKSKGEYVGRALIVRTVMAPAFTVLG